MNFVGSDKTVKWYYIWIFFILLQKNNIINKNKGIKYKKGKRI